MFHWKFIIYLQTRDTLYLIATEIAKSKGFFKKFILSLYSHGNAVLAGYWREWFTACLQKQQASHLIGQKSGDFPPLRLNVYILFTEFSSLYLHCRENRPFDNYISKKLHCPHPYEFSRRIRDHFLEKKKILLTYTQKIGGLAPHLRQKDRRFFIFGLFC